jgi:F-type H+-transporting ATPase subunit delta
LSRVSIRYAKALFAVALEESKLDKIVEDLNSIKKLFKQNNEFRAFLSNPLIRNAEQSIVSDELFSGKVDRLINDFLQLLCRKKRLNQLMEIIKRFDELVLIQRNQLIAGVTSADLMEQSQLDMIKSNLEKMTGKTIILESKTDSGLIGGFKVFVEGVVIDNSIQYQLEKLKEKLIA